MNTIGLAGSGKGLVFRPYRKEDYVPRSIVEEEIDRSVEFLQTTGKPLKNRLFYFWNIAGHGKTWLLHHLFDRYANSTISETSSYPVFCISYEFNQGESDTFRFVESCASQLSKQIMRLMPDDHSHLVNTLAEEKDIRGLAHFIHDRMEGPSNACFLILIDNIDRPSEHVWQEIETRLIEPLINHPCLLVSTGSTQTPRWSRFEIIRMINPVEKQMLSPFRPDQVSTLIEQRFGIAGNRAAHELFNLCGGVPYLIDRLQEHLKIVQEDNNPREVRFMGSNEIVNSIRNEYIEQMAPTNILEQLREIYPLRRYRVEALQYLLSQNNPRLKEQPNLYFLNRLKMLGASTNMIQWDTEHRAYVTNPSIRKLIERQEMIKCHSDVRCSYLDCHQSAINMYWQWAQDTPKVSEEYLLEIIYHIARQYQVTQNTNKLETELHNVENFALDGLIHSRLLEMVKNLEQDEEIKQLLPEKIYQDLIAELNIDQIPE